MDIFLHLNLKTMFEHHLEDSVWKNQQGLVKVLNWKLYDSCGVHCVTMQNILYCLLVEKMYPLTKHTLHQMFNDVKLQVDYECEMAFELLRLINIKFRGKIVRIKSLLEVTPIKVLVTAAKHKLLLQGIQDPFKWDQQDIAFVSSNNSGGTNEAVNTAHGVFSASTQVSAANSTNVDNLSDAVIFAFFASQPKSPQLDNEDL
ncbi:hypothetical protein Tco_0570687 [Tanacetum coccineum]